MKTLINLNNFERKLAIFLKSIKDIHPHSLLQDGDGDCITKEVFVVKNYTIFIWQGLSRVVNKTEKMTKNQNTKIGVINRFPIMWLKSRG